MNSYDDWICVRCNGMHANAATVIEWCEQNFRIHNWHTDGYDYNYYFRRKDDATLFILRWS